MGVSRKITFGSDTNENHALPAPPVISESVEQTEQAEDTYEENVNMMEESSSVSVTEIRPLNWENTESASEEIDVVSDDDMSKGNNEDNSNADVGKKIWIDNFSL